MPKKSKVKEDNPEVMNEQEFLELAHAREVITDRLYRFSEFIKTKPQNTFEIETRLKSVEDDFSEYDRIQTRLEFLSDTEGEARLETESTFYSVIATGKQIIFNFGKGDTHSNFSQNVNVHSQENINSSIPLAAFARLPDLGLPTFYGTYETWFGFIDVFNSIIHNRKDLPDINKFLYLRVCCKGEALKLIDSLEVTGSNYSIALDLLTKRYGNEKAVINFHINELLFKLPKVTEESAGNMRKLLDDLNRHILALDKLKLPVQHWDALLIPIILQKLDEKTVNEWELKQPIISMPSLKDLVDFLTQKSFVLESRNYEHTSQRSLSYRKNVQQSNKQFPPISTNSPQESRQVLYSVTGNTFKCQICGEFHFIYQCRTFLDWDISQRYDYVKKFKLCSNCLRTGHDREHCRSRGCKVCNLKHNTLLHRDNSNMRDRSKSGNVAASITNQSSVSEIPLSPVYPEYLANSQNTVVLENKVQTSGNSSLNSVSSLINSTTVTSLDKDNDNFSTKCNSQGSFELKSSKEIISTNAIKNKQLLNRQVLLSTAVVLIQDYQGRFHECTALLDNGSQSNLITNNLCDKLNLKLNREIINLSSVNKIVTDTSHTTFSVIKSKCDNYSRRLKFSVLPTLTERLPLIGFEKSAIVYPQNLYLADENFNVRKVIDIILGIDVFYEVLGQKHIQLGNNLPFLHDTRLGWVFGGNLHLFDARKVNCNQVTCNLITDVTNQELQDSLTKFWELEELPTTKHLSRNEQLCVKHFQDTTTRKSDGSFEVFYPFTQQTNAKLGDSKTAALKRLLSLEKRLQQNQNLKEQYFTFMQEYVSLGHMTLKGTLDEDNSIPDESFFLPHTAVIREEATTTKCRVVFDASAKSSTDVSLNDLLLVGPTIQEDLFSILLRVRLRPIVLSADIKMMYRCISVNKHDRPFQQILWRWSAAESIKVYTLNTITYGTACAPFQATQCLMELSRQYQREFSRTSQIIEKSFYMDDLLVSLNSEDEALQVCKELNHILGSANFKLRKWASNSTSILNDIFQNSNDCNKDNLVCSQENKALKPLGIFWDPSLDILQYSVDIKTTYNKVTKRVILSTISQIFDPLGLIGPTIIKAKLIIQELWRLHIDWDADVPENLKETWMGLVSEVKYLNCIKIPRHVAILRPVSIKLVGFSDSSERAFGACAYVLSEDEHGKKLSRLLTAKSKVAPIKKLTLPRLELSAAHLLAKLMFHLKSTLDLPISETTYFTDSTIVLAWLKIEPSSLKTFVANRVAKINELSQVSDWKYVPSKQNPADIISRGLNPKELMENSLWFEGPAFLVQSETIDFDNNEQSFHVNKIPELKSTAVVSNLIESDTNIEYRTFFDLLERCSTLRKLTRVTAYIFRYFNAFKSKNRPSSKILTCEELNNSLFSLIKYAQESEFKADIVQLQKHKTVKSASKLLNLNPIIDKHGILRVGGRLQNSDLDFDQQHPIILPYRHKLTELIIISDAHLKHMHVGVQNLLSIIRLKYWPIKGKNVIKRVLKECIRCCRVKPKPLRFLMGSLPRTRVTPCRPFYHCGVDYAGPILIKEGTLRNSKAVKSYICIFVCFTTRAVHIELARDLTTLGFLNCLKRFISRRGKPSSICSDNGLNFVGASNYFLELYNLLNDTRHNETVATFLADDRIGWKFIPARSPHMGGLWEAAVKSAKYHLRRVLGNSLLTYEDMYTLLVQIEACLNSRPLQAISTDVNDLTPLTPSHFLIGDSLATQPDENVKDAKIPPLQRYKLLVQKSQRFWTLWSREYLSSLQVRSKWKKDGDNPLHLGSLVVLMDENNPPLRWSMARVVKLHPGADGVVRVASVLLPSGTVVDRALSKICLLPVETPEEELPENGYQNESDSSESILKRKPFNGAGNMLEQISSPCGATGNSASA